MTNTNTTTTTIPKPGIGFLLASATQAGTPLNLRPELLVEGGVDRLWDEIEDQAGKGLISSLFIHRPFGEDPSPGPQIFDSIHYILTSGNTELTDYYKRTRRRIERFAFTWPQVRLDVYHGSLRCNSMRAVKDAGDHAEWQRRLHLQTGYLAALISQGHNVRMVFDEAVAYEDSSLEAESIAMFRRRFGSAVVVEALPRPGVRWTRGLDAWAFESVYQRQTANRADEYAADPGILGPITRCWDRNTDPEYTIPEFLADCAAKGHTAQVPDVHIARSRMTLAELRDAAQAIADQPIPNGVTP